MIDLLNPPGIPHSTVPSNGAVTVAFPIHETAIEAVSRDEIAKIAAVTDLVQRLCAADTLEQACQTLATELRRYFNCDYVLIGSVGRKGRCRVAGFANSEDRVLRLEQQRLAEGALQETAYREEVLQWPPTSGQMRHGLAVQRQLVDELKVERSVSLPMQDGRGNLQGIVLLLGSFDATHATEFVSFMRMATLSMAEALRLLHRTRPTRFALWWRQYSESLRGSRGRWILTGALASLAACLIPMSYHVKSECRLEPVVKRFVAAPFDAILESAAVRPGDLVKEGQELARLDGGDLILELDQARAELHQARKERAGHLATHDSGKAKLSELAIRRLESKTQLLEQRSTQLLLNAPLDGIVVSGDLRSETGTPVKTGDGLFEIAPLNQMTVEILVPESEITYVRAGMPVCLTFDAFPFRSFDSQIHQIHPRAELIDNKNVFVAELILDNPKEALRPGMRGQANIRSDAYPWVWNYLRHPTAACAKFLGY